MANSLTTAFQRPSWAVPGNIQSVGVYPKTRKRLDGSLNLPGMPCLRGDLGFAGEMLRPFACSNQLKPGFWGANRFSTLHCNPPNHQTTRSELEATFWLFRPTQRSCQETKWPRLHGCCWETFYIFAYCGLLVEIPTQLLKSKWLLPFQRQPSSERPF